MPFDVKKEYKEFYLPKTSPAILEIPAMKYIAVRGKGDPNDENGAYQQSLALLYGVGYTIKMSYKGGHKIEGYFDYVMPPLEGFWWQEGTEGMDYSRKEDMHFISAIRLPEFVTEEDAAWAVAEATRKKKRDHSQVEFMTYTEGLCVQCMHIGPYDHEPSTIQAMHTFAQQNGCAVDITDERYHHEIYLNDPRKCAPERIKTVVRHPIKRI